MGIEQASPPGKRLRQRARAAALPGTQATQRAAGMLHEIAVLGKPVEDDGMMQAVTLAYPRSASWR